VPGLPPQIFATCCPAVCLTRSRSHAYNNQSFQANRSFDGGDDEIHSVAVNNGEDSVRLLSGAECPYQTADELLASCPTDEEIQQIRSDFNIYFEAGLSENGILVPWDCTQGGDES